MSDDFSQALREMQDERIYARLPGRVVFMEHSRKKPDGEVIHVGKKELEEIAQTSNRRDAEGDPCLLALGHTLRGQQPETNQPPPVGYAREFQVRWHPGKKKWVITSTYFIRKKDLPYAKTFPRTSVEYWGADGGERFFDPISLIRRTPELDIGQWTYSATKEPLRYSRATATGQTATVLRYEFEEHPLDAPMNDTPAPDVKPDADHEAYEKHAFGHPGALSYFKAKCAKYAMDGDGDADDAVPPSEPPAAEPPATEEPDKFAALPSATNAMPPTKKEPEGYSRDQALRFARLEGQMTQVMAELKQTRDQLASERQKSEQYAREVQVAKCNALLDELSVAGYQFDRARECDNLMRYAKDEERQGHIEYLRGICKQDPAALQYARVTPAQPPIGASRKVDPINDPESVPAEDYAAVERYQKQCGDYESPLHVQLARALPNKYGHLTNGNAKGN